jgi:hypothetical protein
LGQGQAPRFEVVPHLPDDVALTEPLPAVAARPFVTLPMASSPEAPEARGPLRASSNSFQCLGYLRGKAGIVRTLDAPPGSRFYGHEGATSWVQDNIVAAAIFGVDEAIPALRKALARPLPAGAQDDLDARDFERARAITMAGISLLELGDHASAAPLRDVLLQLETARLGGFWRDTFRGLARSEPAAAARYALEVVERLASGQLPIESVHEYAEVLSHLDPADRARALPALVTLTSRPPLKEITDSHERVACRVRAARIRMGDAALATENRRAIAGNLDTNVSARCYNELVAALYPGDSIAELPVLVRRRRHRELFRLASRLAADTSPRAAASRAKVRAELRAMRTDPNLAAIPRQTSAMLRDRPLWLASRAALGDAEARLALFAWVDDPETDVDAAWIGVWAALEQDLPDALALAERRLRLGVSQGVSSVQRLDLDHGGTPRTVRVDVLDALFARQSPLFALGLVQKDAWARERAIYLLSRRRSADVCGLVASALGNASAFDVLDEALWALTTVGASCAAEMERVAREPSTPPLVRGYVLEHLAMVRSPVALPLAEAWRVSAAAHLERASQGRVRIVTSSPE